MILAIYAIKCDIDKEELERDSWALLPRFDNMSPNQTNRFTQKDVLAALQAYEDKRLATYPLNSIINRSGIHIEKNRRNGRTRVENLEIARLAQKQKDPEGNWRNKDGAPSKEKLVREWQLLNPTGKKIECERETGLSRPTIIKHWQSGEDEQTPP
jgi:hypothetical protein